MTISCDQQQHRYLHPVIVHHRNVVAHDQALGRVRRPLFQLACPCRLGRGFSFVVCNEAEHHLVELLLLSPNAHFKGRRGFRLRFDILDACVDILGVMFDMVGFSLYALDSDLYMIGFKLEYLISFDRIAQSGWPP